MPRRRASRTCTAICDALAGRCSRRCDPSGAGRRGAVRRVAVEAGFVSHATWTRLAAAAPDVELVPAEGWIEALRQVKEPAELERIGSACAVADAALTRLLPRIRPGVTEHELALELEWEMRTHGAEALAFDVACLSGPRAALPHGSPGARPVAAGAVLLFDFGAQVCGYRSDMTRTLFVGEPTRPRPRHLPAGARRPGRGVRRARGGRRGRRAPAQSGHRRGRPRPHRRRRPRRRTSGTAWGTASAWPRTSCHRSGAWRAEAPVAVAHGLLGGARCLPRRRDRGAHRGPRRLRSGRGSRWSG